jgi:hypothetical protein
MAQPARTSQRGYWVNVAGANHASLLGRRFADSLVEAIEQVAGAKTG